MAADWCSDAELRPTRSGRQVVSFDAGDRGRVVGDAGRRVDGNGCWHTVAVGNRMWWRHLIVAVFVALFTFLGARGTIAQANFSRFDLWQVDVVPAADGGLDITETIDLDFANDPGHGLTLAVGTEFGDPTDIVVSSPDAPDEFTSRTVLDEHQLRIGDPQTTVVGQHRYQVQYRLPQAPSKLGDELVLDLLVEPELDVERFSAKIRGLQLDDPKCLIGSVDDTAECAITSSANGVYQIELDGLSGDTSVTVEGTIVELSVAEPASIAPPPRAQLLLGQPVVGIGIGLAGLAGALVSYLWCRRRGRNEIYGGGGAAEAASVTATSAAHAPTPNGTGPAAARPQPTVLAATGLAGTGPAAAAVISTGDGAVGPAASTSLVTDGQLLAMATVEFEPPAIAPWEARVLLSEQFRDADVFNAYLSGLAGLGAIEISPTDGGVAITSGPDIDRLDSADMFYVDRLLGLGDPFVTGTPDRGFSAVYQSILADLHQRLVARHWWKKRPPRRRSRQGVIGIALPVGIFGLFLIPWIVIGSVALANEVLRYSIAASALVSFVVCALVARVAYRVLLRARTAAGSALTLRAESFRRFLDDSEGSHVQWAWEHKVLREYSGWAVALGEASAWSSAIENAAIAGASAAVAAGPFALHRFGSSVSKSARRPASESRSGWTRSSRSSSGSRSSRSRGSVSRGRAGGGGGGSRGGRW